MLTLRLDSRQSCVVNLAAMADNYTESPADIAWFNKLHPRLVKPHSSSTNQNENVEPPQVDRGRAKVGKNARPQGNNRTTRTGARKPAAHSARSASSGGARTAFGAKKKQTGTIGFAAGRAVKKTGGGGGAGRTVRSRGGPGGAPSSSGRAGNKLKSQREISAPTTRERGGGGRGGGDGGGGGDDDDDDDIMAMLARHNKQFKPKARYVARAHSSRDVKRWEVRHLVVFVRRLLCSFFSCASFLLACSPVFAVVSM